MSISKTDMDDDEVNLAVRGLLRQANTLSMSHLKDPLLQHQFRSEYRFLGKCLLSDYEGGVLSKTKVVNYVRQERQSLIDQSIEVGKYTIGLVAGVGQVTTGYGLCVTSSIFSFVGASWCVSTGAPMMLHGGNNIYENSYNITGNITQNWKKKYTGDYGSNNSFLRNGYRAGAKQLGYSNDEGDLAYGLADIATSFYGLSSSLKTSTVSSIPNAKQFKLYSYHATDYQKGWRTMTRGALTFEMMGNSITAYDALTPYMKEKEK
uniref:DUF4225 domain-containing protein n=1 Tax=Aliivibrio wodanis TaxID=80852 RepID=A0A5Q4ZYL5_9GAMM|nr:DUF4225 domain-containing protein [Aliivibrio wodanis]VVV06940.1 hypothetical protein AW0309160_04434 [Aliivibrio wodanis]